MSMSINPAGQSWQQPPVPRHDDLPQKLMQERGDYREEIAAYQKAQVPPPTDEEMNRRFGSAYSVEISSLQSGNTLTSAIPELETHSHL